MAEGLANEVTRPAGVVADVERKPDIAVTADARWALGFLARIYTTAKARKVLNSLPTWIQPDITRVVTTRNAGITGRNLRNGILQIVVQELIDSRELPADLPRAVEDLHELFRLETVLGTALIEQTAVSWMGNALASQRAKLQRLLSDAAARAPAVSRAARLVVEKVDTTKADIRDPRLYAIIKPKHQRWWRDGSMEERLLKVRYGIATRECLEEARQQRREFRESDRDPGAEIRGLIRTAPARVRDSERRERDERSLENMEAAFEVLRSLTWHPKAVALVKAWKESPANGKERLSPVVSDSIAAIDSLANRLAVNPEVVWQFPAALRAAVAGLGVAKDPLTLYALAWADAIRPPLDEALELLGDVLTLLELFGGPLAPVAAVADAIVQTASAAVSLLRQLDQDNAETATEFEDESQRLSTGGKLQDPILKGAGALLAAKGIPGQLRKLRSNIVPKGAARPPGTVHDPRAIENSTVGARENPIGERGVQRPQSGVLPDAKPPLSAGRELTAPSQRIGGGPLSPEIPKSVEAAARRPGKRVIPDADEVGEVERSVFDEEVSDMERKIGRDATAVDEAAGVRKPDRPPAHKSPPRGKVHGDAAEARQWMNSHLPEAPRDYRAVLDGPKVEKIERDLDVDLARDLEARKVNRNRVNVGKEPLPHQNSALERYVANVEAAAGKDNLEKIKEFEFKVVVPDRFSKGGHVTVRRRFDRLQRGGKHIVITETKGYLVRPLNYERAALKQQLIADTAILEQYPYAQVVYNLDGRVLDEAMMELEKLEGEFPGRFIIISEENIRKNAAGADVGFEIVKRKK